MIYDKTTFNPKHIGLRVKAVDLFYEVDYKCILNGIKAGDLYAKVHGGERWICSYELLPMPLKEAYDMGLLKVGQKIRIHKNMTFDIVIKDIGYDGKIHLQHFLPLDMDYGWFVEILEEPKEEKEYGWAQTTVTNPFYSNPKATEEEKEVSHKEWKVDPCYDLLGNYLRFAISHSVSSITDEIEEPIVKKGIRHFLGIAEEKIMKGGEEEKKYVDYVKIEECWITPFTSLLLSPYYINGLSFSTLSKDELNQPTKPKTIMNYLNESRKAVKDLFIPEDIKLMRDAGWEKEPHVRTQEGTEALLDMLFEENRAKLIEKAKEIKAEIEKDTK